MAPFSCSHIGSPSRIKLTFELFCALVSNLAHFKSQTPICFIHSTVSGASLHDKRKFSWYVLHVRLHTFPCHNLGDGSICVCVAGREGGFSDNKGRSPNEKASRF